MSIAAEHHAVSTASRQNDCELAEVFQRYAAQYARTHHLSAAQGKAAWAITHCRTAVLGGHREWCDGCGFQRYVYHSCRNRHCPKCQSLTSAAWVQSRRHDLLPVPYFHQVFTLPHELNALILWSERNQRALLKLLFDAAAQTLLAFGRQQLQGTIGFTLVLHTWDQQLRPRRQQLRRWRKKAWCVYSQPPFAGPRKLIDYLGRYTHRVAISNHRLLSCQDGQVTFTYRDRRDGDRRKQATLPAEEFLGRFLQHVLPDRFTRVRHYGLLANRGKRERLARCRQLLGTPGPVDTQEDALQNVADWMWQRVGIDITRCPRCGDVLFREPLPAWHQRPATCSSPPASRGPPGG